MVVINYYDTMLSQFVTVEVEESLALFLKETQEKEREEERKFKENIRLVPNAGALENTKLMARKSVALDAIIKEETLETLKHAISNLNEAQQEAIRQVYFCNCTTEQMANYMGIPLFHAENLLQSAIKQLLCYFLN